MPRLAGILLAVFPPAFWCCEAVLGVTTVMLGRMNLTGHFGIAVGDAVAGLLNGLAAVACGGMVLTPVLRAALGRRAARLCLLLTAVSWVLAAAAAWGLHPYSAAMPKRLMVGVKRGRERETQEPVLMGLALTSCLGSAFLPSGGS